MEVIFKNVSFSYNKGMKNQKKALENIDLVLQSNKIHGIIGPIGSGKSTLLELMNGITKPDCGEILVGNYDLTNKKRKLNFNKFRYDVGLVYQFPEKQFFSSTVGEEISFVEETVHSKKRSIKEKVKKVLKMVGLDESYIKRSTLSLNAGEKRRVAIASVLISNPKVLILDEPTIGLDDKSKKRLMKLLVGLKNKYLKTIIIVTHDVDILYEIADNIVVLNKGKVITTGKKSKVFANVELLNENNTPIPSIVKLEKMVYDKTGIDLGIVYNVNDLVRSIARSKDLFEGGDSDE